MMTKKTSASLDQPFLGVMMVLMMMSDDGDGDQEDVS